jgi:IclR family acetate operon transcriptional repressor
MRQETPIKATATTFTIIETLAERDGAGISELAADLDLPKSTVHDHLATLDDLGFIAKEGSTYQVGTRFLRIGTMVQQNKEIYNVAVPEIRELAALIGEHTSLMIEENGLGVYLHTSESSNTMKVISADGTATRLHTTAPGKAILAHLPEDKRSRIIEEKGLESATENTITDREELEEELREITQKGYAVDREEAVKGMRGVAAPVIGRNEGSIRGSISAYGPGKRTDLEDLEETVVDELLRTANVIEVNLSY